MYHLYHLAATDGQTTAESTVTQTAAKVSMFTSRSIRRFSQPQIRGSVGSLDVTQADHLVESAIGRAVLLVAGV